MVSRCRTTGESEDFMQLGKQESKGTHPSSEIQARYHQKLKNSDCTKSVEENIDNIDTQSE